MKESLKNLRLNMYIILVKCNDHLFYVTKIIWSVIDTAKDQHKSKQEVYVYLYSDFFPRANVLVHSETKYYQQSIFKYWGMFTPFKIKVTVGCIQIKTDQKCLYVHLHARI